MKLLDLWSNNSYESLAAGEGRNPWLLRELVQPYLENLYQDLIVYHEKNIVLTRLSEINFTEKRFGASAKVEYMIRQMTGRYPEEWSFGCTWELYSLSGSYLAASPYVGFRLILDADVVAKVHWCMKKGDQEQAMKLIVERDEEGWKQHERMRASVSIRD